MAKLSKCQFGMSKCTYLGHVIGSGSVEPEPLKVLVVKRFEAGAVNKDAGSSVPRPDWILPTVYTAVALPLIELTKKLAPTDVIWTVKCETVFQELKRLLCSTLDSANVPCL